MMHQIQSLPLLLTVLLAFSPMATPSAQAETPSTTLVLAVANSTCDLFRALSQPFQKRTGHTTTLICKSSGRLAKGLAGQAIEADYYLSANKKWMDFMVAAQLVQAPLVRQVWGNTLVVAAPLTTPISLTGLQDLAQPKVSTLLIGDPSTAPFGRYAKQVLQKANIWSAIRPKIATRLHITLLAQELEQANATTVGILFATNLTPKHRLLFAIPAQQQPPIQYFAAPLDKSKHPTEIKEFLQFMQSDEARTIITQAGFLLGEPNTP
ncbi:molybdenum ABC transporter, periplasmic molybdate-binding protein [Magnetococcus marinus MC-1]|uniref:Molybdenum ABC transporter, periplasmic molybdate-binding protein n=1 Tax=Magnetococcus marinus (strain ATCC BAA-1437 / JCM 17883 / MC-1) TaxID=156889 RepID=A0LBV9_MAGMM|nr:molybdate ABC transporter substrate-binding protein [Magnetococcus marinus]ABK45452.1 molybdenum ABC transporter, periplasmic molybdate-binding protein [Magnetococcus marinus MC-1]